jgi:hypothetical protein
MTPDAYGSLTRGCFDYTENLEFQGEMVDLGMRGLTLKECGDYYGLDPEDWATWCKEHPITALRHNSGKARGIALAGRQLIEEIKRSKIQAIAFYLKTQGDFTEKSVMRLEDETKNVNMPRPPTPTDPVEAAKAYARFIQGS